MKPLNKEETIAAMSVIVVEYLIKEGHYEEAINVSDILLEYHPTFAYIMVKKATAAYYLLKNNFYSRFPTFADVPKELVPEVTRLMNINEVEFKRAENLGWKRFER